MSNYNYMKEAAAALREIAEESSKKEHEQTKKLLKDTQDKQDEIADLKEYYEYKRDKDRMYKDAVRQELLETALNGIYITAMGRDRELTTENLNICQTMVSEFIKEQGGASAVLRRMKDKNYLLETLRVFIEEEEEEVKDNADEEQKDMNEVPEENKEEMLDKMEKEDDVDSAVEIIANRISTAEEDFIKKNAEDKEKIENIVKDVNDRIEAVKKDNTTDEETTEEIKQEAMRFGRERISAIYNPRTQTVFDKMIHEMTECILKDKELKESYTGVTGQLDMERIVGNVRCMYGFLEFCSTVGLAKIDESYIEKVITEM